MSLPDRRTFIRCCALVGFSPAIGERLWDGVQVRQVGGSPVGASAPTRIPITREQVKAAEALIGVPFTDAERDLMLSALNQNLAYYEQLREVPMTQEVLPSFQFSPVLPVGKPPAARRQRRLGIEPSPPTRPPATRGELAFLSVMELAGLLRTRQVSSTLLTGVYLDRLRRYGTDLRCLVTITEERALQQAAEADRAIAAGNYLGPLHGIPYGVKDLLSVPGYPTTWGAGIYKDRVLDQTATVVDRLDAAGAVLVAKLSTGELALNQTWFGGRTMNPWQRTQGAGGSSGGSAVATAAGLVGFGIGTETLGSIVTPASRNGVTGLRPTFGRVSRHGIMTLCWSLDKVGPIARSVADCAVVLDVINGPDGKDPTVTSVPYSWHPGRPVTGLRVGYFKSAFESKRSGKAQDDLALAALRRLGVELVEVELPTDLPVNALRIIMVEAAAAFDNITRTGEIDLLSEQHETAWPNFFRQCRLIPAVEYLQATRIRTLLMQRMDAVFRDIDVLVAPTFTVITVTNLTGHPCAVVPNGFGPEGIPTSISFIGKLYGEAEMCTVARAWQEATGWHKRHPTGFVDGD
jgi:Asp-tRNA(Asn)/Glu-tRNA(Gln) amidotransferase A subunit family amidase